MFVKLIKIGIFMNQESFVYKKFYDYTEHLCQMLHSIGINNFTDKKYVELVQRTKYNFFIQNLFVFHICLYIDHPRFAQYKSEIQKLYDSIELYHYTNINSLEKIIGGQTLRFSQITTMNDYNEAKALIECNKPIILEEARQKNCENQVNDIIHKIEIYSSDLYSFSLSTRGDDAAQWERYGINKNAGDSLCDTCKKRLKVMIKSLFGIKENNIDSPCGVCIKIPMKKLRTKIEELKSVHGLLEIVPIEYTPDYDQNNPILALITEIALLRTDKEINLIEQPKTVKVESSIYENALLKKELICRNLALYSSQVKHESFGSESEIRLVMRMRSEGDYYLLNVGDFNDLITSIIIGPGAEHIKGRVENLLIQHNLDKTVSIENSKCSLRT